MEDRNMKWMRSIVILMVSLCLSGCTLAQTEQEPLPETIAGPTATSPIVLTQPAETKAQPTQPPAAETTGEAPTETVGPTETLPTEATAVVPAEPEDEDFVRVRDYLPEVLVELPYATEANFTGQRIYDFSDVWLRYGTVKKLSAVLQVLNEDGFGLKIWDGYRPRSAQFKLWEVCPDPTYVSDPNKGSNSHTRGCAVDITLVTADGTQVPMPTDFDDFTALADRDYSDCTPETAQNAQYLEEVMTRFGFKPYRGEWWHFADTDDYPVEESFEPLEPAWRAADCEEYISLRSRADTGADVITRIPADAQFQALARSGAFLLVEYQGLQGYVLEAYTRPCE